MSTHMRAALALGILSLVSGGAHAEPSILSRWTFDDGTAANAIAGAPAGSIERARSVEGHAGKALLFEDWSIRNYLKPDPRIATRVVVPHDARLNPPSPFRVTAWIYPTAEPVYYGGIVEKGHGYGASYRLVLLRSLKVEASVGERHLVARSASPVTLNAWHEVTLAVDSRTLELVVDGAKAGQISLDVPLKLGSNSPLIIGERFTGRIDEVSITTD